MTALKITSVGNSAGVLLPKELLTKLRVDKGDVWINLRVIKAFHDRQINEHGGLPGLRDEGLLLSALSRPENAFHYSDPKPDLAELAAAYGFGLAKNHPFNDANKRTALIAMRLFLKLNGYDLAASPEDKYKTIIRVAASDISEDELAQWIGKNVEEIKS